MQPLWFLPLLSLLQLAQSMDNLRVAFEWKKVDFDFPSEEVKQKTIQRGGYIDVNNLPLGIEVYEDRLFITVPRWKSGVAASLNYIKLSDAKESPKLRPYPNWEAHNIHEKEVPEIVSPFRIRADKCGRLWVLDTGVDDILGNPKVLAPNRLLIYDLRNDQLLRSYEIPKEQLKERSFLANIAVEDQDCEDSYAYLGDLGAPALIVYSWKRRSSWKVTHNYFNINPLAGEYSVAGVNFEWSDALFGLALSAADQNGFSTLYFHPMNSFDEFAVSTEVLHNESLATSKSDALYRKFKHLGNRGPKSQSGVSFLDKKSKVLFYALINLNAVACWKTTNPAYTMESQGRIFMSNETMVFPNDIKVDGNDNLWVLSNRLPKFMYSKLNYDEVNFRILTAKVNDAIRGTTCDAKLVLSPTIVDRIMPAIMNTTSSSVQNNNNNIFRQNNGPDTTRASGAFYNAGNLIALITGLFVVGQLR